MFKKAVVVVGSLAMLSLAAPAAYADNTSGDSSILGGNQIFAPITIPVNVCGNAVAVLGMAIAGCKGGAAASVHR